MDRSSPNPLSLLPPSPSSPHVVKESNGGNFSRLLARVTRLSREEARRLTCKISGGEYEQNGVNELTKRARRDGPGFTGRHLVVFKPRAWDEKEVIHIHTYHGFNTEDNLSSILI